jgi:branched-chain amino acid transport system ATP-binding protein
VPTLQVDVSRDGKAGPCAGATAVSLANVDAGYVVGLPIVQDVSLEFAPGEIAAIIGTNGAGKSTLAKAIVGLVATFAGRTEIFGVDVTKLGPSDRTKLGLGYVPQIRDVFGAMTVDENLKMGGYLLPPPQVRERVAATLEMFPRLLSLRGRRAEKLSGGERKMVAVARALVADPRVLIVDEPTAGLSPHVGQRVLEEVLPRLSSLGVGVIVIEQRVREVLAVADRCHVLAGGRLVMSSTGAEARENDNLGALILGAQDSK